MADDNLLPRNILPQTSPSANQETLVRIYSKENVLDDLHENELLGETHFDIKGFTAIGVVLKQRQKATRKWLILIKLGRRNTMRNILHCVQSLT